MRWLAFVLLVLIAAPGVMAGPVPVPNPPPTPPPDVVAILQYCNFVEVLQPQPGEPTPRVILDSDGCLHDILRDIVGW